MTEAANDKAKAATEDETTSFVAVEAHLSQVLASASFRRSERLKSLLSFLVEETLAGRGDRLNEFSIAQEVFNRSGDFDPARDTIVRVEVRRLRQKLAEFYDGPGAGSPVRIEIARGYRPEFQSASERPAAADGRRQRGRLVLGAVTVSLAALLVIATTFVQVDAAPAAIEPEFLTTLQGREEHPSLSPDGSQVVFAWQREGRDDYDVYIQMTDGGEPVALADSPATEYSQVWSPDGAKIAFLNLESADTARILVVSPLGGSTRSVAEIAVPKSPMARPPSLAWTPDSESIVAPDRETSMEPYALYRFGLSTASRDRLTYPPNGIFGGDTHPAVSPSAEHLAFVRRTTIGQAELLVKPLSGGGAEKVAEGSSLAGLAWTPDGKFLVASVEGRLRRIDLSRGGRDTGFPLEGRDGRNPSIASQSGALAYTEMAKSDMDIWRIELDEAGRGPLKAERLISSTRGDFGPRYSPDGRRIAFASRRSSHVGIWIANRDGSDPVSLSGSRSTGMMTRWSPKGDAVSYTARTGEVWSIWSAPLIEPRAPRRVVALETQNACGSWSPDGRWLYFDRRVDGRRQIWRSSRDGSNLEFVRRGGVCPSVSPDGRFLYFGEARVAPTRLMRAPVQGGPADVIAATLLYETNYRVTKEGGLLCSGVECGRERRDSLSRFRDREATSGSPSRDCGISRPRRFSGRPLPSLHESGPTRSRPHVRQALDCRELTQARSSPTQRTKEFLEPV